MISRKTGARLKKLKTLKKMQKEGSKGEECLKPKHINF